MRFVMESAIVSNRTFAECFSRSSLQPSVPVRPGEARGFGPCPKRTGELMIEFSSYACRCFSR
jgi:hypothetical protein